ncbi:Grx4 family monothiol glutaredoxin [Anaplasma bovis]|uniref:Grx4 family monothiol glutaredoxin n=1 Tax=Anaplasma bovis TaxID=186733 RepID=UPI002FF11CD7
MSDDLMDRIRQDIENNDIVLYMKGTGTAPQCGFSGMVVEVLRRIGVSFKDIDVLRDPALREAVKKFADWPTIPQLYIRGEFIGGCDIVREMYASGELLEVLKSKGIIKD